MKTVKTLIKRIWLLVFLIVKAPIDGIVKAVRIIKSICRCKRYLKDSLTNLNKVTPLEQIRPDYGNNPIVNTFVHEEPKLDLSIIVPMYNAAAYICECLDSITRQQTQYKYEVILVDDGSTDNTLEMISEYLSDERFYLIRQENHGQAYARNRAIEQSSGRFIMMVDADDVLLADAIEVLVSRADEKKAEIVEGKYIRFRDYSEVNSISKNQFSDQVLEYEVNPWPVLRSTGYSWAKVYNRELWTSLRYPEGYIFEDVITKFVLRRKAKRIINLGSYVYGYHHDTNSSSHKLAGLKHLDSIWVYPRIVSLCKSEGVHFDDVFYLLSLNHITILNYVTTLHIPKKVKLSCFAEMQKQLNSIQFSRPKKVPHLFELLERSVLEGSFEAWQEIAGTITKYRLLKKWREIN